MHQPYYEDLVTREHILPWVRLHALKDYYGMVALLREFPDVRMTFNLVPSLLVQLEAFAGRARTRPLSRSRPASPPSELTEQDAAFIARELLPRAAPAHDRRPSALRRAARGAGRAAGTAAAAVRRFTLDDLRDLQVWQKLAWIDPFYLDSDDARGLAASPSGGGSSEDDKALLRTRRARAAERGDSRVSRGRRARADRSCRPRRSTTRSCRCCATPTSTSARTRTRAMPRQRFVHPEDAREQLTRGAYLHERLFGSAPAGVWPSEGSVSDAMVPLVAAGRLPVDGDRRADPGAARSASRSRATAAAIVEQPERLYTPVRRRHGGGTRSLRCSAITCCRI